MSSQSIGTITLDGIELNYRTVIRSESLIFTYIGDYRENIYNFILKIFQNAGQLYDYQAGNKCLENARVLCKHVIHKMNFISSGGIHKNLFPGLATPQVLIIDTWKENYISKPIELVYKSQAGVLGCSFHALFFSTIIFEDETYYIAIEPHSPFVTSKYSLEIYIGTYDEFIEIIRSRYQATSFYLIDYTKNLESFWSMEKKELPLPQRELSQDLPAELPQDLITEIEDSSKSKGRREYSNRRRSKKRKSKRQKSKRRKNIRQRV